MRLTGAQVCWTEDNSRTVSHQSPVTTGSNHRLAWCVTMTVSFARAILEQCFVSRQQFTALHTVDVQLYRHTQRSLSLTTVNSLCGSKNLRTSDFSCSFVWVRNLVFNIKGRVSAEGVRNYGAEGDVWGGLMTGERRRLRSEEHGVCCSPNIFIIWRWFTLLRLQHNNKCINIILNTTLFGR